MGKKVIVTVHGLDWQREKWKQGIGAKFIRMGERMAVRCANSIIVLSRNVQQYFRDTYSRETVYIPNGVTKPELVAGESILQEYGLESRGYILYLGRLVPEKGIHYLLEAFKAIKTDLKLVIAGGRSDADDYVTKLLASSEDDDRVIFTDFVQGQTLDALYSNAYMYVLPSDVEGMPLSLLEAMSYGNCCLVSNIAECAEVVEDKAVTFEKGNVTQLAEKLQQLCDDPEETQRYRDNAADFICNKYHWDGVVTKTLELYE
jgi:glycosyltransferase involved in cell wall biosynthesis